MKLSIVDEQAQKLADEISDVKFIDIPTREINTQEIARLQNNEILRVQHPKGFSIQVRKQYIIDTFCNVSAVLYSTDKFMVADELFGVHPMEFNALEMSEYVNGLLGY